MSAERPYYHVAPVVGVPTVFAGIEFPESDPPEKIVIADVVYVRSDQSDDARNCSG